ncbi:hypothetical protein [Candidatus Fukatsuia symbiotica]|nr:hypothetical protein [Candidatus Fukatsuia symbiotica]
MVINFEKLNKKIDKFGVQLTVRLGGILVFAISIITVLPKIL